MFPNSFPADGNQIDISRHKEVATSEQTWENTEIIWQDLENSGQNQNFVLMLEITVCTEIPTVKSQHQHQHVILLQVSLILHCSGLKTETKINLEVTFSSSSALTLEKLMIK